LASSDDKVTQIKWGIEDFKYQFGHKPLGMWLPETAVDLETLNILAENGIELVQTTTVGDDLHRMEEVIKEAHFRSPIVITTGGLGPTEDDLTREAIAQVTHSPLGFNPS
jgi:predicted glycosyl hydrolase (DUF1957 family)